MRLSDHLAKASWSLLDRAVFLAYGFVGIVQVSVLPKEEWGVFLFFDALYTITFTLADGFVLQALVKFGADERRRRAAMTVTFAAHLLFIGTLSLAAWILQRWLAHGFHEPRYLAILWLLPLISLLTVPRSYALKLFQMLIRTREIFLIDLAFFGTMTVATLYRVATHTLTSAEAMIGINVTGAIAGSVIGIALAVPHLRFSLRREAGLVREMASFGFFQGLAVASAVLQQRIDEMMVQYYCTTLDFAVYGTAKRFFKIFEAARDAAGTVVFPAVARLHAQARRAELATLVEKMLSFMLLAMAPVVVFFWVGGSAWMFHLFFGAKYDAAIPVFTILCTAGLLLPFMLNLTVLTGLGRSRTILSVVVVSSLVSVAANLVLVPRLHANGAALALVIAGTAAGILATRAVRREVPFSLGALGRGVADAWNFLAHRFSRRP